jgi:hypothetical protein
MGQRFAISSREEAVTRGTGVSCWELFEAFVNATKPADKTVQRWRAGIARMAQRWLRIRLSSFRPLGSD